MKPLTAGRVARRLLAFYNNDPKKWTKYEYTNNHGAFCVAGALREIIPSEYTSRYIEATRVLSEALGESFIEWNDSRPDFAAFKTKLQEIARTP